MKQHSWWSSTGKTRFRKKNTMNWILFCLLHHVFVMTCGDVSFAFCYFICLPLEMGFLLSFLPFVTEGREPV